MNVELLVVVMFHNAEGKDTKTAVSLTVREDSLGTSKSFEIKPLSSKLPLTMTK